MPPPPRLVAIIGSGETSASMARVHRGLLARFAERPVPATLLDTPYAFQENAANISAAIVDYFANRLGNPIAVASFRRSDGDVLEHQQALARVRDAAFVFSGPGSPTYALRHWAGTEIPVSGNVVRSSDDRITVVLDLLIDANAAILEGYLTRVQLLDILV